MAIRMVSRFAVDDVALSALHARAFGGEVGQVAPWAQRLARYAVTWVGAFDDATAAGCEWLHVDFESGMERFYLRRCGFRPSAAGLLRLGLP